MNIQVIEVKPVNQGNLKAFVSIQLEDIVFHDFRIIQQAGQRAWVSVPQSSWKNQNGKTCYKPLVELPASLKEQVSKTVLDEWGNYGN